MTRLARVLAKEDLSMATFNVHEAKSQLSRLLQKAEEGEEVIIARDGQPIVRLTPIAARAKAPRVFGQLQGLMTDAESDVLFSPEAKASIQAMFDEALDEPLYPHEFDDESRPAAE